MYDDHESITAGSNNAQGVENKALQQRALLPSVLPLVARCTQGTKRLPNSLESVPDTPSIKHTHQLPGTHRLGSKKARENRS